MQCMFIFSSICPTKKHFQNVHVMVMVSTVEALIVEPLHQPMHFQQGVKVTKITFPLLIKGKFDKRIKKIITSARYLNSSDAHQVQSL